MHRYTSIRAYGGIGSKNICSVNPFLPKICLRNEQTYFCFVCMFLCQMMKINGNMIGVFFGKLMFEYITLSDEISCVI